MLTIHHRLARERLFGDGPWTREGCEEAKRNGREAQSGKRSGTELAVKRRCQWILVS